MPSSASLTNVLIVEDSPSDLDLILEAIGELDEVEILEVRTATSLGEAFRLLAESLADLILLDLGLPDSRGLDTLRRIHSRLSHVPIVVFTSLYNTEIGLEAVRIGAQDYLVKGETTGDALTHAIHCAVVRHQSQEHQARSSVDEELDALDRVREALSPQTKKKR
jgi:DNA-binding NarL/FixJ family response regulator